MHKHNPEVDWFFEKPRKWQPAYKLLREILLDCGLSENLKWGKPTYGIEDNNFLLMHGFKNYCALLFFKGVLLNDPEGILVAQTENVQSARQIRFTKPQEINDLEDSLKAYVQNAIEIEQSGQQVEFKKTSEFAMPAEFQTKLDLNPELKTAFESLTPGRQRAYLLYFGAAKQSKTRTARVEKYTIQILKRKGLKD